MRMDVLSPDFKVLEDEVLVRIYSFQEEKIKTASGLELHLASVVPVKESGADFGQAAELLEAIKKSGYKDAGAYREFISAIGHSKKEVEDNGQRDKQSVRHGVIVKLPLKYGNKNNYDRIAEPDFRVGEQVWFDAFQAREQRDGGDKVFKDETGIYILIPYQSIFAAKRGEDIVPLNGYFTGRNLSTDRKIGFLWMPNETKNLARVEVTGVPKSQPIQVLDIWKNTELKVGDIVWMEKHYAVPLDSTLASETDLVRFYSRVVIAIEK